MSKTKDTFQIGRKAGDGTFCSVAYANAHRGTTVVETMPKPTGAKPKK